MRLVRKLVGPFFALPAVTAFMRRTLPTLDKVVFRLTGGRFMFVQLIEPAILLETIGAKSGLRRHSPLLYARDGDVFVVAASNWGQAHHPAWSGNLLANQDATVIHRGRRIPVRAQPVTDETERSRLWVKLDDIYVGYRSYRAATREIREVRMFRLQPLR